MANEIRLGARLRAARKAAGFKTSKEFSKKHKVPESTYSQHESGSRTPDESTLKSYSAIFGVNYNWLKTGKGLPYKKSTTFEKNVMEEELLELKRTNHTSSTINLKLLSSILKETLNSYLSEIPINSINKIAKKIVATYEIELNKKK